MTDNRTTELLPRRVLHDKLDEHGIDYWCAQQTTFWNGENGSEFLAYQYQVNGVYKFAFKGVNATPEQAIAATLGKPNATSSQEAIVRSFLRKISPNRDWDYLGEHEHAMIADLVDDIAATLGEPIIRCRDCKHATISTTGVCKYCEMFVLPDTDGYGADPQVNFPLDFFCGFAERKEVD